MQTFIHRDEAGSRRFVDRRDAGRQLALSLARRSFERPIVIALPRGGAVVGFEVARALGAPLDVWVVRKIGVPGQLELGVGALAEGGYVYLARERMAALGLSEGDLTEVVAREKQELQERVRRFRAGRSRPALAGQTVLLVDDGVATGGTVRAAVRALRAERPARIILAVPVASPDTLDELAPEVDDIVCLLAPASLSSIGGWYEDFDQVSSDEVVRLLELARVEQRRRAGARRLDPSSG